MAIKKASKLNKIETVTGTVSKLNFASVKFSAGRLETQAGAISFSGSIYPKEGDYVVLSGKWFDDPKWGRQFKAERFEFAGTSSSITFDQAGLAHYLAVSKQFTGLGPAKAKIVASYASADTDFAEVLASRRMEIAKAAKVSPDTIDAIRNVWTEGQARSQIAAWLGQFELTEHQISSIIDAFGNNAKRALENNPYVMIGAIEGFGFARVDEIAMRMGFPKDHPKRLEAAVVKTLDEQTEDGHTWTDIHMLAELADAKLALDDLNAKSLIQAAINALIEHGDLAIVEGNRVYNAGMLRMEQFVVDTLRNVGHSETGNISLDASGPEFAGLNDEQAAAVLAGAKHRAVCMTGSAGVGKTFCIARIVDIFQKKLHLNPSQIFLCAPTGKAARRITESMINLGISCNEAKTIHRTLGYRPDGTWVHDHLNQLMPGLVIVDEVSMADIPLAYRLFRAINWTKSTVILVGDKNQLPPVGAGNILRDILATKIIPIAELTKVVRQAGPLKHNSNAVLAGKIVPTDTATPGQKDWYVIDGDKIGDPLECQRTLLAMMEHRIQNLQIKSSTGSHAADPVADVQVISPTKKGPLGTQNLNILLQRLFQKIRYNVDVAPVEEGKFTAFHQHDKIIQTKNDYKICPSGVMNGTIGTILSITDNKTIIAQFDGIPEPVEIKGEAKRNIALAYALTIHKMQGSEIPIVIAILHKAHTFQMHRSMVYTAVTRARSIAILLGDKIGMNRGAHKTVVDARRTMLFAPEPKYASAQLKEMTYDRDDED